MFMVNAHHPGHKMNELIAIEKIAQWDKLKMLVVDPALTHATLT